MKHSKGVTIGIYSVAGVAMLASLVLWQFPLIVSHKADAVIFTVAAFIFAAAQMAMQGEAADYVVQRLQRQQTLGGIFLVATGVLMCNQAWHFTFYLTHNEWIVSLAIACVMLLYTAFRLPSSDTASSK